MVNRGLVIAVAKEPFRRWLQSLPEPCESSLEVINEDRSAYLIPEFEDDNERDKVLKKLFDRIFEDQLADWWTKEEDWPEWR